MMRESVLDSEEDLSYFENLIQKYQTDLERPLLTKRAQFNQDDPIIELQEVYEEVKQIESSFRNALEACGKFFE